METRWSFDPDQFVYACLQLPVPLLCLWHLNQQKRKARQVEKLDDDAPVLLPIYMWLSTKYFLQEYQSSSIIESTLKLFM